MRAVVQRVARASVSVDGVVVGAIGAGVLVLLGVRRGDGAEAATWLARKVASLRIFDDEAGHLERSLLETGGEALVVSQFTLYGDCRKGRRPSWVEAAPPEEAVPMYERFCSDLRAEGVRRVETGRFGASMAVSLVNDGPVTLILEAP